VSIENLQLRTSDLITDWLVLRPWSADEVAALVGGDRLQHWAEDFPAEGDRTWWPSPSPPPA
jgi:ribosomal-protein-alanine N-acetyltransferase